jgi:hypothetical protein
MPNAGDLIRASDNLVRVGCRVRRVATQSITTATQTNMSWDTEDEDIGDFISVTSTTITIPAGYDGIYAITAWVTGAFTAGRAFIEITVTSALTGTPSTTRHYMDAAEDRGLNSITLALQAGDSFTVGVFHSTGSSVNFTGWCSCYRLGV